MAMQCAHACLQILCGRLRVMAQPHIREPLPAAAAHRAAPAAQRLGRAGGAQPAAAAAGAEQRGAGGPAGADADANADAGAGADPAECWVPDVMRCRWRRDPAQRRLLPRLRANLRAMAMLALILAGGCRPGGPAGPVLSCAAPGICGRNRQACCFDPAV